MDPLALLISKLDLFLIYSSREEKRSEKLCIFLSQLRKHREKKKHFTN